MPFTFSHPAIVLPIYHYLKKWVSLTGLIVGSIVPDFEYFIRMRGKSVYSHTLGGLLWFDLPLGLLLCFLFHNVVRNVLFSNLPRLLNSRLSNFKRFSWNKYFKKHWLLVITSIIIGAFLHLVWDHFTHERGYALQILNFLNQDVTDPSIPVPEYSTLQILSSIAGGIIVIYAILQLPVTDPVKRPFYQGYWIYLGIIVGAIMVLRFYTGLKIRSPYDIIINLISGLIIALIISSLFLRKQYYR